MSSEQHNEDVCNGEHGCNADQTAPDTTSTGSTTDDVLRMDRRATATLKATKTPSQAPNDNGSPTTKLSMTDHHRHLVQYHLSSTLLQLSRAPLPARLASLATLFTTQIKLKRRIQMSNKPKTATVTTLPPPGGRTRLFNRGESQP